jgi:orotate phosphoribosyltransferase
MQIQERPPRLDEGEVAKKILDAGALDIRDVDAGQEPFLYSSGNFGPGYVNIKGLVGRQEVFKILTEQCALKLADEEADFQFIAANATGGMVPGYQVREDYTRITGRDVPYIYVRNTRKIGGHQEYTTGLTGNPEIPEGSKPLIFEELVNFAETTNNSRQVLEDEGYIATHAGTLLHYENPEAIKTLDESGITLIWVARLKRVLEVAADTKKFSLRAVEDYQSFLRNPQAWQVARGLKRVV